jgi:uncharacterized membrane protein
LQSFDDRTKHRLESFSDVVMGFCLAEIGVNLVIPKNDAGLATMWPALNAFAFSFFLIATLWWNHHRLFASYIVLNMTSVVMNFTMLAALALATYFQQVVVHFITLDISWMVPAQLWLGSMGLVFALLAGMYAIGIWHRHEELDPTALRWGVNRAYRSTMGAVMLGSFSFLFRAITHQEPLGVTFLIVVAALFALRRVVVPQVTQRLLAARAA